MKYNTFIFDLDGTLLDTIVDLQQSVNYAISKYNYPQKSYEDIRSFLGNGIYKLISLCIPDGTNNKNFDNIVKTFFEYYDNHVCDYTKPYDGIIEMLQILKQNNKNILIVSNKNDKFVKKLSDTFFGDLIDIAVGENKNIRKKPDKDMVYYALETLNLTADNSVYIGDSEVDILTAHNSNIPCICVSWGFRDKQSLLKNGATTLVDTPIDIINFI